MPEAAEVKKVSMTFTAVIADGEQTKTVLGGAMGDEYRPVLWQYGDTVGVCRSDWYGSMYTFTNVEPGETSTATFVGQSDEGSRFYAFYPLSASPVFNYDSDNIVFNLPSAQTYEPESFARDAMPMVARANAGEIFQFNSLAGVFAINLTGVETVKSVSFTGYDIYNVPISVAGKYRIEMYTTTPGLIQEGDGISTVTLNCNEGVTLDPSIPTPFYIVLPPTTYNTFTISVATTDGKVMLKRASNPLTIRSANVTKAGSLVFVADEAYDLSEFSTANSYVITDPGIFSFDATTIGNGGYGFVEGARFHTESPFIRPVSAELLWEDRMGVVSNVTFDGSNIVFLTGDIEGNALIAVKDEAGKILWSWHIWRTDEPQEHTYVNEQGSTYVMMDRALGSISAVEGDIGGALYYQWGRKDPFRLNDPLSLNNLTLHSGHPVVSMFSELSRAVQRPTSFATGSDWVMDINASLWSNNMKTIYDPCPAGWRVPVREVWNGIRVKYDRDGGPYGVVLQFNEGDYFWYPDTPRIGSGSNTEHSYASDMTELWTSDFGITRYITYNTNYENTRDRADGHLVRCMKDENYESSLLPMVRILDIRDINSEGATIDASVIAEGVTPVTERGIIWGTTADLTIDSPDKQIVEGGLGDFSFTLTGLENATKYYVRAYAINDYGVNYSEFKSFATPYEGNIYNLSIDGTANCYIVPVACAEYSFDATVKGNSNEPVGDVASIEVLWATDLYVEIENPIFIGDFIAELSYEYGEIHFTLPVEPRPGNAVIAVRDANGTILWSWHIWIVDFDPDDTQVKYTSGLVMMDRNLGATSVIPSSASDFSAYGLYYQWGRKDPLVLNARVAPSYGEAFTLYGNEYTPEQNTIEYTYSHPTVFYDDANWGGNLDLWHSEKTINDPCPVGWRVPSIEVWNNFSDGGCQCPTGAYLGISAPNTESTTYYPFAGVGDWNATWSDYMNLYGYYWSTTSGYIFKVWNCGYYQTYELNSGNKASIRCMKDEKKPVTGDGNDLVVDDKYEW